MEIVFLHPGLCGFPQQLHAWKSKFLWSRKGPFCSRYEKGDFDEEKKRCQQLIASEAKLKSDFYVLTEKADQETGRRPVWLTDGSNDCVAGYT